MWRCVSSWFCGLGVLCVRYGSNSCSKCAYCGLSVNVLGVKYCFCLCMNSWGKFFSMLGVGPGLSWMSPLRSMITELFHV